MRHVLRLAFLAALVVTSTPSADAQLGGLVDRARSAVSGAASSAPSASSTTTVDYARLMSTRFFPNQGTFLFNTRSAAGSYLRGDDIVIFPPSNVSRYDEIGQFVVRRADGRIVGRQTATYDEDTESQVFIELGTSGAPEWSGAVEGGTSYSLDLEVGGAVVGTVPFTADVVESGDPFDPSSTVVLEGPWRTHAFFQHEVDRPEYILSFIAWIGPTEADHATTTEVSVRRNGQEVAWGYGGTQTTFGPGVVGYDLMVTGSRDRRAGFGRAGANADWWTIQDVTPGTYEVVISTEDGPIRTMTIEGADGAFVPHARSSMEYQPRSLFLSPRLLGNSGQSETAMSAYWIAP